MTRYIYTAPFPHQQATQLSKQGSYEVITPSRLAARAISAQHQPLQAIALKYLQQQGQIKASPLQAQKQFRQTLQEVLQPADLLGTARAWMPAAKSLLQSCPSFVQASADSFTNLSARTAGLIGVAQQYQSTLHESSLFDADELYWRADELEATKLKQQPLLVYGYFQPRADELAWLNKVAGSGSLFFIDESPLFADMQAAVSWLQQRGWEVMSSDTASSDIVPIR